MRLAGALTAVLAPCLVAAYSAIHYRALGADGGVLWCIALLGALLMVCVVGAHLESRHP